MRIEKEKVQLNPLKLTPLTEGEGLVIFPNGNSYRVSALQFSYLQVLQNAGTIEGLVQFYLGQGWLVSFRELFSLIEMLVTEQALSNPTFKEYFQPSTTDAKSWHSFATHSQGLIKPSINLQSLPFFRSLDPTLAQYLTQKSEVLKVPPQTRIIQTGQRDRDLFINLSGEVKIYHVFGHNQRQLVSTLGAGSIFGERGFLLNQARTADVVAATECEILRIQHLPEFDSFIRSDKAQSLQYRFWVLQALQSSPFFKNLPSDSLDSLIFSGTLCQTQAHQVLFREGQPGATCYVLVQGNVVISQKGKNINVLGQGSCFGEISLLMSGGLRTATVTCQQPSILLEIHQNEFYKVLAQNIFMAKEIETLAAQRLINDSRRS